MPRPDPAWLDAQYNNRALVPEHPQILERWAKASALARQQASRRLDLRYGDGPNETLDLFPAPADKAPVLVFIHGGWWRAMDKADYGFIAPSFAHDGVMVVVPNYALCPAVTIEAIVLQMVKALVWTYRKASLYGGDPDRIVVAGHSAGGHLAAMMLSCLWGLLARGLPGNLVKGALSISGVFDLEPISQTPFLQPDLRLEPKSVKKLSPVLFPAPKAGALCAVVGADESDELRRQTGLIRDAWGSRTVRVCEELRGHNHFNVLHDLADPEGRTHQLALALARSSFG